MSKFYLKAAGNDKPHDQSVLVYALVWQARQDAKAGIDSEIVDEEENVVYAIDGGQEEPHIDKVIS